MASLDNESLLLLVREVRGKTLELLDAAQPHELTWSPPGTANHILWHAGHALWLQDVLCLRLLSGRISLPGPWEAFFGAGSRPQSPPGPWPSRDEVRYELAGQLPRLLSALAPLTWQQLDTRPRFAGTNGGRTLRQSVIHGLHDEANHQGEMYLLLKLQRLGRGR
jgi:hypothetical protein